VNLYVPLVHTNKDRTQVRSMVFCILRVNIKVFVNKNATTTLLVVVYKKKIN
jgi:hypothetical protein